MLLNVRLRFGGWGGGGWGFCNPSLLLSWVFEHDWTHAVLGVLYACVLNFCICACLAQLSMFHMERNSRNLLIIIIISVDIVYLFVLFSWVFDLLVGNALKC